MSDPTYERLFNMVVADEVYAADTYYIPIPNDGGAVTSIHIGGIGTGGAAATAVVRHTDFPTNLAGEPLDPTEPGTDMDWKTDADVGTLTITATNDENSNDRGTFSNQPRHLTQLVLTVSAPGRIRIATTSLRA